MTKSHSRTGLGLYIAKKLADKLNAEVWFDAKLGKGSTSYLWVPPYKKHKLSSFAGSFNL